MSVQLLIRQYPRMIGLARYTVSLLKYLTRLDVPYTCVEPAYPWSARAADAFGKVLGKDLNTFLTTYPVAAPLDTVAVKHFTTQQMASLFSFKPGVNKVVVTVHDIIPYLMRDDPVHNDLPQFYDRWMDQTAMHNLRRADRLIAISGYTKKMLVEKLDCSPEKIRVILYGLDHELFKPAPVMDSFLQQYALSPGYRYLLYVGSELPRKNLPRLLQAIAKAKAEIPKIRLLKVGTPIFAHQFESLKALISSLNLEDNVIFIDHPPQADLVTLYSFADLFVFPSLFEGFGMPPLEAMACGAPVICSNAASLPEVVGDAAITIDPYDVEAWASAIVRVLNDSSLRTDLSKRGLEHAGQFTWERHARETTAVYQELE
ncbi:MAG: glycosyltransferase family 4 protein [Anaerolineales bacterium]|nr:glycosyltransferase family 4 protein [Anaerolineales bacterium]